MERPARPAAFEWDSSPWGPIRAMRPEKETAVWEGESDSEERPEGAGVSRRRAMHLPRSGMPYLLHEQFAFVA